MICWISTRVKRRFSRRAFSRNHPRLGFEEFRGGVQLLRGHRQFEDQMLRHESTDQLAVSVWPLRLMRAPQGD